MPGVAESARLFDVRAGTAGVLTAGGLTGGVVTAPEPTDGGVTVAPPTDGVVTVWALAVPAAATRARVISVRFIESASSGFGQYLNAHEG